MFADTTRNRVILSFEIELTVQNRMVVDRYPKTLSSSFREKVHGSRSLVRFNTFGPQARPIYHLYFLLFVYAFMRAFSAWAISPHFISKIEIPLLSFEIYRFNRCKRGLGNTCIIICCCSNKPARSGAFPTYDFFPTPWSNRVFPCLSRASGNRFNDT
jgi:hypothetical protein